MSILNEKICNVFEGEDNKSTFKKYIQDLEQMCGVPKENLKKFSDDQILEYIDYLYVISISLEAI